VVEGNEELRQAGDLRSSMEELGMVEDWRR
jgi:hypothetical protein